MTTNDVTEEFTQWWANGDMHSICNAVFNFDPSNGQQEIIRNIAQEKHKRLIINCMTRYGKTRSVAAAIALYLLTQQKKRICVISPTYNQTDILRGYLAEFIADAPIFEGLITRKLRGAKRLKQQLSKRHLKFLNGCELLILTAEGKEAGRLAGFGGDLIIIDESCLINAEVFRSKITRMLGDSPNSILVEISNPWNRDGHYWDHWRDYLKLGYTRIHIGWEQALQEGRTTIEWLQEQCPAEKTLHWQGKDYQGFGTLRPMEWEILYESKFPAQSEDALIPYDKIEQAADLGGIDLKNWYPTEVRLGCDPADKGKDLTVIMAADVMNKLWRVFKIYSESKSEQVQVAGRLMRMQQEVNADVINVDYGMGVGIVSIVKDQIQVRRVRVNLCQFGSGARDKRRFLNRKAEMYFYLAELFVNEQIKIPNHPELVSQLGKMRWKFTAGDKIVIVDPDDKSPDFADALVFTVWEHYSSNNYPIA